MGKITIRKYTYLSIPDNQFSPTITTERMSAVLES